jgi:hypothetical protein
MMRSRKVSYLRGEIEREDHLLITSLSLTLYDQDNPEVPRWRNRCSRRSLDRREEDTESTWETQDRP